MKIDETDQALLEQLSEDGRRSHSDIARRLGLSPATIQQRFERLKQEGIIRGTRVDLDLPRLGMGLMALVGVHLNRAQDMAQVVARLAEFPEVGEAHYTSGNYALILKVHTRDLQAFYEFLSLRLQTVPGIRSTESFMCLATPLQRPPRPPWIQETPREKSPRTRGVRGRARVTDPGRPTRRP